MQLGHGGYHWLARCVTGSMASNPRATAAVILHRVLAQGQTLSDALVNTSAAAYPDRSLTLELCYGSLRWFGRLAALTKLLLRKPIKRKNAEVECLIWLGLYQLIYTRIPAHAAIHETVQAAKELGKAWSGDLINAVLRNFERRRTALLHAVDQSSASRLSHPRWLLALLQAAYPADWERICHAANLHAPMTLRVNLHECDVRAYLDELRKAGLEARPHPLVSSAIVLERPTDVNQLPGFRQGLVSVQDAAAQLAAPLLDCCSGMRVLDACAAPGGKTAHLVERYEGTLDLVAVEKNPNRMHRLKETLVRVGAAVDCRLADAARPEQWWDGRPFDRILLDAPCSATGVIRRHPDIKWRRKLSDVAAYVRAQTELISALCKLLSPDGMLLYATCSILPQENRDLIMRFVAEHEDVRLQPFKPRLSQGEQAHSSFDRGWQILPGEMGMDGFYYAALRKVD